MKMQFILFLLSTIFIMSCDQVIRLSEEDYSWMPYKGNETLVLKSSEGETDTIFFIRKDTLWGLPDPASSTSKYEIAAIFCKHSDPYIEKSKHRYLNDYFFELKKTVSKRAELAIHLSAEDANFYHLSSIKIDSLNKIKPRPVTISYKHYDDVYIIEAEDYLGSFFQRTDFVTKLYWSKSGGLVRYDKKDGVYWELVKKY